MLIKFFPDAARYAASAASATFLLASATADNLRTFSTAAVAALAALR